jgi:hypothetical protein
MEQSAVLAHEYMLKIKQERIKQHKLNAEKDGKCSGITFTEMLRNPTKQKSRFSKTKKYAYTRLWNHKTIK